MKYSNMTWGRMEAIINKLGGEEAVDAFLAGRMEVVKRKFHQFGDDLLDGKGRIVFGSDFNPKTQIDEFARKKDPKIDSTTHYLNPSLTSENFMRVTHTPEVGKEYGIKMIPIRQNCTVAGQEIVDYMKTIPGIRFFGAQGETYLQEHQPDLFPVGKWSVSFDEKKALWKDAGGYHRVPDVHRHSDGDWGFRLGDFGDPWRSDRVLVCFCDSDESPEA